MEALRSLLCADGRKDPMRARRDEDGCFCFRSNDPEESFFSARSNLAGPMPPGTGKAQKSLRAINADPLKPMDRKLSAKLSHTLAFHLSGTSLPVPSQQTAAEASCSLTFDAVEELTGESVYEDVSEHTNCVPYSKSYRQTQTVEDTFAADRQAFVGEWVHVRSDHYDEFLVEALGLRWAVAQIAARIYPTPQFELLQDGRTLKCTTICLGARPVVEMLVEGEGEFHEPNLDCDYAVVSRWVRDEASGAAVFVAERHNTSINHGRPTLQKRWITHAGELVIEQDWGGKHKFVATFARANGSPTAPAKADASPQAKTGWWGGK